MIGIIYTGIKAIMSASIIGIGYYATKNFTTKEKEEIIKTENILKYEYFPIEKVNTDKKDNILKYTFIEGDKMGVRACIGYNMEEELQVIDI